MTGGSPGQDVAGLLARVRLIPVITIHDAAQAEPLAEALKAGGLPCAEVTLRTDAAEEAIRIMSQDPDMLVGPAQCSARTRRNGPSPRVPASS